MLKHLELLEAELKHTQMALRIETTAPVRVEDELAGTLEQQRILEEEGRLKAEGMRAMRELRRAETGVDYDRDHGSGARKSCKQSFLFLLQIFL